jgi:hypothetical protein
MSEGKNETHQEADEYGDPMIASYHAKVPGWLQFNYWLWIAWGIIWFYFFWNGSSGWLDRGYWSELQRAANTTFPTQNMDIAKD